MPTIIIQPDGTAGKDASVSNGGGEQRGDQMVAGTNSNLVPFRSYIQFPLDTIPTGRTIISARMFLYLLPSNAEPTTITVKKVASLWTETGVTWDNQPQATSINQSSSYIESSVGVKSWDLLAIVNDWLANPSSNFGIQLSDNENTALTSKHFATSDHANEAFRPRLQVIYGNAPTPPTITNPNGGESVDSLHTITWSPSTDIEVTQSQIRYEIQLSQNNGSSWKNIVSLTEQGVTSYNYNFASEQETALAKIRIRAWDGEDYGTYDMSDGVFTIQHNVAPTIPTNLTPNGVPIDRLKTRRLAWQHNDSPNDIQSKADVQWRHQGDTVWNDIASDGPDQEYFIPPNTFPNGQTEWRVRTYDGMAIASPWSNVAVFTAAEPTNAPTIIQPSGSVNVARPVIEWTSVSQSSYQLVVEDSLGVSIWDTGEIASSVRARTVGVDLLNGGTYKVKVRVKDGSGLFSSFAERTFVVSYTPPAKPIVSAFGADGFLAFDITTPAPTGTQPSVDSYEIYKRINDIWTRVAYGVGSSFNDYHVKSGITYEYYVKAMGANGTTSNSDIVSQSTTFRGSWIHALQDAEASLQYFRYNGTGYETYYEPESAVMKFAGRTRPVVHFGNYEEFTLTVRIQSVEGMSDMDVLKRFVRERETVCYRDADGNLIVGHILALSVEKEYRVSSATITIVESDFNEGV